MENEIVELNLEERNCDVCMQNTKESLWSYEFLKETRSYKYKFTVNNVICRTCGFVYVSPVYEEEQIGNYYENTFALFEGSEPDYSIDVRLSLIEKIANKDFNILEIGSNQIGKFQEELKKRYNSFTTLEINNEVTSDIANLQESVALYDLIINYFVLEHITHPNNFFKQCYDSLKNEGTMIVEVPDISIYPADPVALINYEHTSHFSKHTLDQIAINNGFQPVEINAECSRGFGFTRVYSKKRSGKSMKNEIRSLYAENKDYFLRGLEKYEEFKADFIKCGELIKSYRNSKKNIVFWGANESLKLFLEINNIFFENITIIDSNPSKRNYLGLDTVRIPSESSPEITAADTIFIFTKLHKTSILKTLKNDYNKSFSEKDIFVLDI